MTVRHLLDQPHHDGSELYVPAGTPALGDVVPVRFRVPASATERALWVRTVRDAEPRMVQARLDRADAHERWYVADVPVHNPVTSYRALLDEPGGYRWLNGRGLFSRDVPDAADFRLTVHEPAPAWTSSAVVYQIFPDRFARSGVERTFPDWAEPADWDDEPIGRGPSTPVQLYGGDLLGIEQRLDHLQRLGVDTVYLTPVFPSQSNHRYDARTFDHVDPLLGGDEALVSLRRALHGRGMRLVGDFTTNHTGVAHEWFEHALRDRSSEEAEFYYWDKESDLGYVAWLDVPSLPKLNYGSSALARRMVDGPGSVIGRWLGEPFALDGWRIDVANMTGRYASDDFTHQVARTVRATMTELNPDAVLVSEHFHDAAGDLTGEGWQVNMNYSAFTKPLWTWLVDPATTLDFLGVPTTIPRRGGVSVVETMREFDATVPWKVTARQWNMLGSHDTPRLRTVVGDPALVEVAAGLLFTYPGTPALFAGDEGGATGTNGEHARVPMPWDQIEAGGGDRWDARTFATYRSLIALRRSSRALREGGLRWAVVSDDALAYLRETADERVLVVAARAPWSGVDLPRHLVPPGSTVERLYGDGALDVRPDALHVGGDGPGVSVWRLA
ncbi:glycoside hydrolase family 13 protein [Cellulomonas sp. H30R-01]|uniref:glycoside hydrolase family 13 protein n=1 Tax=Cellulomonas sp. H30R-01 TaxID=2704467 RepID=UPI00138D4A8E|nr:glycoside hydrolase family 13 protein [Cellulomonas sp. H30R-01]QHT56100.1 glycoside hydrolase family 13 protein [Cellulomonas sp. H30R-01]